MIKGTTEQIVEKKIQKRWRLIVKGGGSYCLEEQWRRESKNTELQTDTEQVCPTCMDTQVTLDNYITDDGLSLSLTPLIHFSV